MSVSGLSAEHRAEARKRILNGVNLLMRSPAGVHYTQGPARWQGISDKLMITKGQYPHYGDCSSTATWLIWSATRAYDLRDVVNDSGWRAGYTGTMLQNGKRLKHEYSIKVGDLAIYGNGGTGEHVALCIGGGRVFSHGSEAGPYILDLHYRGDLMCIRRYL